MPKIENHSDYNLHLPYWNQIRTFTKGMRNVQTYLQGIKPIITYEGDNAQVLQLADTVRNRDYKDRAKYVNFSKRTRDALSGAVFRKAPTFAIPTALEFIIDNCDGAGLTLEQMSKSIVSNLIEVGRHGLFVDYGKQAKITQYQAENIRSWHTTEAGILDEVVLIVSKEKEKRLYIDAEGLYAVDILENDVVKQTIQPKKADGSRFDAIPFIFCGSINNSPDVDDMPLWSIVDVSQGHYQNSADYEDILRCLIPTPAITVPNSAWLNEMLPNGIYTFGDGSIIPLPQGGSATLLQASENQMIAQAMRDKEAQLVALGARIITDSSGVETAEAVRIKFSSENSVLDNLVGNASQAIERCLEWCAEFTKGANGDIEFKLNREFFDTKLSAQEISAQIMLLDRGVKAMADVRGTLRKAGEIDTDRTDDEIDSEVEKTAGGM